MPCFLALYMCNELFSAHYGLILNYWCPANSSLEKGVGGIDLDNQHYNKFRRYFLYVGLYAKVKGKTLFKRYMAPF